MTQAVAASRFGAILLPALFALVPAAAMAQASPTPPADIMPQGTAPAPAGGIPGGMMGHGMMMGDANHPAMPMGCMGMPCGPPAGAPASMGGMPQPPASMGSPGAMPAPAAPAPMGHM